MILGTYKLHNAENEMMLSLCHYVNSYSPEGATNMSTFYLHYSSYIETVHSFFASITKTKIRLVLLFGSIYQHFTFLQIATCFTWFCC